MIGETISYLDDSGLSPNLKLGRALIAPRLWKSGELGLIALHVLMTLQLPF